MLLVKRRSLNALYVVTGDVPRMGVEQIALSVNRKRTGCLFREGDWGRIRVFERAQFLDSKTK